VVDEFLVPNHWVRKEANARIVPLTKAAQNLTWLPRTGMVIVRHNPANGCFERAPLVKGITAEELPVIEGILRTDLHGQERRKLFPAAWPMLPAQARARARKL